MRAVRSDSKIRCTSCGKVSCPRARNYRNVEIVGVCSIAAFALFSVVPRRALDRFLPHFLASKNPDPCASIDLVDGSNDTAILKDAIGATHFLAILTRQIPGIESPEVLAPHAPDWFARAWNARRFIYERLGKTLPSDAVGLAINSQISRSQDQLHIHIDCVKTDVASALVGARAGIGVDWSGSALVPLGKTFVARRLDQPELDSINPFRPVASGPRRLRDGKWPMPRL
jgi:CDP-diacylglycerol pyrophosphatase